jgi:hypothetical protein
MGAVDASIFVFLFLVWFYSAWLGEVMAVLQRIYWSIVGVWRKSPKTTEIYTYASNKNIGKIKRQLDSLQIKWLEDD